MAPVTSDEQGLQRDIAHAVRAALAARVDNGARIPKSINVEVDLRDTQQRGYDRLNVKVSLGWE